MQTVTNQGPGLYFTSNPSSFLQEAEKLKIEIEYSKLESDFYKVRVCQGDNVQKIIDIANKMYLRIGKNYFVYQENKFNWPELIERIPEREKHLIIEFAKNGVSHLDEMKSNLLMWYLLIAKTPLENTVSSLL